jgi:hypothetical protein
MMAIMTMRITLIYDVNINRCSDTVQQLQGRDFRDTKMESPPRPQQARPLDALEFLSIAAEEAPFSRK